MNKNFEGFCQCFLKISEKSLGLRSRIPRLFLIFNLILIKPGQCPKGIYKVSCKFNILLAIIFVKLSHFVSAGGGGCRPRTTPQKRTSSDTMAPNGIIYLYTTPMFRVNPPKKPKSCRTHCTGILIWVHLPQQGIKLKFQIKKDPISKRLQVLILQTILDDEDPIPQLGE